MLFEIALVLTPTKKEAEDGKLETLLVAPFHLIARDDRSAGMQAIVTHKDKLPEDISRVNVLIRPFA